MGKRMYLDCCICGGGNTHIMGLDSSVKEKRFEYGYGESESIKIYLKCEYCNHFSFVEVSHEKGCTYMETSPIECAGVFVLHISGYSLKNKVCESLGFKSPMSCMALHESEGWEIEENKLIIYVNNQHSLDLIKQNIETIRKAIFSAIGYEVPWMAIKK